MTSRLLAPLIISEAVFEIWHEQYSEWYRQHSSAMLQNFRFLIKHYPNSTQILDTKFLTQVADFSSNERNELLKTKYGQVSALRDDCLTIAQNQKDSKEKFESNILYNFLSNEILRQLPKYGSVSIEDVYLAKKTISAHKKRIEKFDFNSLLFAQWCASCETIKHLRGEIGNLDPVTSPQMSPYQKKSTSYSTNVYSNGLIDARGLDFISFLRDIGIPIFTLLTGDPIPLAINVRLPKQNRTIASSQRETHKHGGGNSERYPASSHKSKINLNEKKYEERFSSARLKVDEKVYGCSEITLKWEKQHAGKSIPEMIKEAQDISRIL